jgi:bla regulator protein blaR1
MANRANRKLNRSKLALLAGAALTFLIGPVAVGVAAQAALLQERDGQQQLAFEVASVKPSHLRVADGKKGEGSDAAPVIEAGHLTFRARGVNLFGLIVIAFGLKSCRPLMADSCPMLSGGPAWLAKDTFDIEAKSPSGAKDYATMELRNGAAPQLQVELRNLLSDRFHLKAHFEERQLPVYAFTVADGGIRMKKTAGGGSSPKIVFKGVDLPGGIQATQVVAAQSTVQELADLYAKFMDRPVIDATGLTGRFDFTVEYEADPDATGPFAGATSHTLFAAFEKQAGLKLKATRGPVSVLVIDSAAHPTGN